jgi:hypothetical protein
MEEKRKEQRKQRGSQLREDILWIEAVEQKVQTAVRVSPTSGPPTIQQEIEKAPSLEMLNVQPEQCSTI